MSKKMGMVALISGGIIYLATIRKKTQQQIAQKMSEDLEEVPLSKIKEVFPEFRGYKIKESDSYYVNTSKKVLFAPDRPRKIFLAHEAGHVEIHGQKGGLKKFINDIRYIYFPIAEENEAWEYAKQYADDNEDVDEIKKPFVRSYTINLITKAALTLLSAAVGIAVAEKYSKDKDKDDAGQA